MARVWLVRADGGELADEFRADNHISIGFRIAEDLSGVTDLDVIEAAFRRANPDKGQGTVTRTVKQINAFLNEIQPGDHVLTPKPDRRWLMHGIVEDDPAYFVTSPDNDPDHHGNRRPVAWQHDTIYRYSCTPTDQKTLASRQTIELLSDDSVAFWASLTTGVESEQTTKASKALSAEKAAILNEIVSAFEWDEFQDLVAALLSAMGCEILEVAPPGPDGGVDIKAVTSNLLTPSIPLFVQVKRYKLDSNIGAKAVRELRAGVQFGGRGVFVTTSDFVKSAPEVASEPGFPHISLINGSQFVDLLREHWDDIPDEFRSRLNLKPGLVPA